jgi:hypothetical protein
MHFYFKVNNENNFPNVKPEMESKNNTNHNDKERKQDNSNVKVTYFFYQSSMNK